MKISFVATVLNEEETVGDFLKSILHQTKKPDEIIIADGGSTDATASAISNMKYQISNKKIKFKFIAKKGNRSVGRNEAIKNATGDIIICSDAGCILDKNWVENITKPFIDSRFRGNDSVDGVVDVVAGYYKGKANSIFKKCLIPYVLVMPDKINEQNFLPASRSMAFKKSVWKKIGGFPEEFSHNEDYVFAQKLKNAGAKIVFNKDAIVYWIPRKNLKEAFIMFFRFALGDAEALIFRSKVILVFIRYLLGIYLLLLSFVLRSSLLFYIVVFSFLLYIIWVDWKNYKYVRRYKALLFLPILQFISDLAVLLGTTFGFLKKISFKKISQVIINNKGVSLIIGAYAILMVILINWGIPNKDHPFSYFMDEWHQAQAVRTVATVGTPNVAGSANGSMFHFFLTGLYLIPFVVLGIVNPFAIESSVLSLDIQHRLFQILRLNTLLFGIGSIILIAYIGKKYFKLHPFLISFLFVVNPIWLTLSNYFKYDIALVFWILLSFLFFLRYSINSRFLNLMIVSFVCAVSFSVKMSAIPLFPLLVISFFLFNKNWKNNMHHLLTGILIFVGTFLLFGIPDLIFGKGNISEYLYDNLVRTPSYAQNYILGMPYSLYLITKSPLTVFGNSLFFISVIGTIFMSVLTARETVSSKKRIYIFLLISFVLFIASLLPLKIEARGNRLLVLLPFIVLLSGIFINNIFFYTKSYLKKNFIFGLAIVLFFLQVFESLSLVYIKLKADPRQKSSDWIVQHISKSSIIGIENIPIYQFLPDIILKEFYFNQYHIKQKNSYTYETIHSKSSKLPSIVVITNGDMEMKIFKQSPKKSLVKRIEKEGYKKIAVFSPYFNYYKIFGSDIDYYISGILAAPVTTTVYRR